MKLTEAITLLSEAGIEDARTEARRLFSEICGVEYSALLMTDSESDDPRLISAVRRRCERTPLQYILGEVQFYRESYKVTEDCLIPRSDTAILVDEVIKRLHFTKCFVGADGFSVANGLTASDFDTARINQLVVAGSDKRILLADTSKAGKASVIHYAPIDSVDTLVTNKWLANEVKAELLKANINIIEA